MNNRPRIPDSEFVQRAKNVQALMKEQGIDALLAFGNEAEPQFARYLCDYWPSFETCGVLLAQQGDPVLLIGPESMTFASDRSRIHDIRRLAAFRESSNPEYPGEKLETVADVLDLELLGELPEDQVVSRSILNHRLFVDYDCEARSAMLRIASRVSGEEVPLPAYGTHRISLWRRLFPSKMD